MIDSSPTTGSGGPKRVGRYLLFDVIASGGMATVHFGRLVGPAGFSRVVAIKRLHAHLTQDPAFVAMLLDEARLAARVRHPNVVPMLDVADLPGELCLVMEYVDGEALSTLQRILGARDATVPISVAATTMVGALMGLHAAHEACNESGEPLHVVHRDVSPQNILLGRDGLARVLDFGIAYAAERIQVTREGQLKGKLSYMAPEQVRGRQIDRRTDIYAASVVLWELLTGRRLLLGDNSAHTMHLITDGHVEPPSSVVPSVPPGLDEVVLKGLSRNPEDRFGTAAEMANAIERSVTLASASEASRWLVDVAGDSLASRERTVAKIESVVADVEQRLDLRVERESAQSVSAARAASGPFEVTEVATDDDAVATPLPAPSGRSRKTLWIAVAVGVSLALVGIASLLLRPLGAEAGYSVPPVALASSVEPSPPLVSIESLPIVATSASAEHALEPSASPTPMVSTTRVRGKGPKPAMPSPPSCDPPYTIDRFGVRVPKKACF